MNNKKMDINKLNIMKIFKTYLEDVNIIYGSKIAMH